MTTIKVAIVCIGEVSLSTAILCTEPFRAANRLSAIDLFEITFLAPGDHIETIRREVLLKAVPLDSAGGKFDVVFMLACYDCLPSARRHAISWLRGQVRHGAFVVAIDYATLFFAEAGLLDGYRATTHWAIRDTFAEQFPKVLLCDKLFVVDRDRATTPGHMAVLELSLEILVGFVGSAMAQAVQNELIYPNRRGADAAQIVSIHEGKGPADPCLKKATQLMRDNISNPLSILSVAEQTEVSVRELQRCFKAHLSQSPQQFYLTLRLQKARDLLYFSHISIQEIALSTGFSSYAAFYRLFRDRFDVSPSRSRHIFRAASPVPNGRRVY